MAAGPDDADAARPAARVAGRVLPRADRDRRGLQLQRLLARPRAAQLHHHGLARLPPQLDLPQAVLEVREDVADRLGAHRRPRLPARVLPRPLRDEAQVRPAPPPDCALPDELPAARARVEGDPRQRGRDQLVPRLDGPAGARSPDLAAALQPVRGDARAGVYLAAVRRAADLRLAREPRPTAARGGERPRREPAAGLPQGDPAALGPRDLRG